MSGRDAIGGPGERSMSQLSAFFRNLTLRPQGVTLVIAAFHHFDRLRCAR